MKNCLKILTGLILSISMTPLVGMQNKPYEQVIHDIDWHVCLVYNAKEPKTRFEKSKTLYECIKWKFYKHPEYKLEKYLDLASNLVKSLRQNKKSQADKIVEDLSSATSAYLFPTKNKKRMSETQLRPTYKKKRNNITQNTNINTIDLTSDDKSHIFSNWIENQLILDFNANDGLSIQEINKLKINRKASGLVNYTETIEANNLLLENTLETLYPNLSAHKLDQLLTATANRIFTYCFDTEFKDFYKNILANNDQHGLAEFYYSTMHYYLVGDNSWKHWNKSVLDRLKQDCDSGKKIVYIAGGADFYQLLDADIYNIQMIDPMPTTATQWYPQEWTKLVNGKKDDTIIIPTKKKTLRLTREKNTTKTQSTFIIYDNETSEKLGKLSFARRKCTKNDFKMSKNKTLVMSCNEMWFLTTEDKGWPKTKDLSQNLKIHVKQLLNPVTKHILLNIEKARKSKFRFIEIGGVFS